VPGVEDWADIRRLRRSEGRPISEIAGGAGVSRNTVNAALASDGPPECRRGRAGSVADAFEPRIREPLQAYPRMPSTVIAERIGWPYSIRTLSGRVAGLRPAYLPPDPASHTSLRRARSRVRLLVPAHRAAGGVRAVPQEHAVAGAGDGDRVCLPAARWASAVLVPTRQAEDLFAGCWQPISALGAVPRVLVQDGEGAIGRWRGRRSELAQECQGVRGCLAATVVICRPTDPETKGLVPSLALPNRAPRSARPADARGPARKTGRPGICCRMPGSVLVATRTARRRHRWHYVGSRPGSSNRPARPGRPGRARGPGGGPRRPGPWVMWGYDQPAGEQVGDLGAEVKADEMQAVV
jgi:transposase